MLALLTPVLASMPADDPGKGALILAIPLAANLGGIGIPIGTPPNATAVRFMAEAGNNVTFMEWSVRMIPFVLIMVLITWLILPIYLPFKTKTVELKIPENKREMDWRTWVVWITFVGTILLWATEGLTGISSNIVAMIPLGVLAVTGIFGKEEIKKIDWTVLWLVAGGFALGTAMEESGLANNLLTAIPFGSMKVVMVVLLSGFVCFLLSVFISNSATAAMMIPIMLVVARGMSDPSAANQDAFLDLGGTDVLIAFVATCASLAMVFPISTPPNAIASSTGLVRSRDMARMGLLIGLIGFVFGFFWMTKIFPF